MAEVAQITRGDEDPDLVITIGDSRADADFSWLTTDACRIIGEMNGTVVLDDAPDLVTPAADGKSAVLRRSWGPGETAVAGRMYIVAKVTAPDGRPQTFPRKSSLRLDIRRAPGDA